MINFGALGQRIAGQEQLPVPHDAALTPVQNKALHIARWAALVTFLASVVSPPLTYAALVVSVVAFAFTGKTAWLRLRWALMHPVAWTALAFWAWVFVSAFYADVTWAESAHHISTWRKLLWLIYVMALFGGETQWVHRILLAFVGLCAVASIVILAYPLSGLPDATIKAAFVLRHPSTQSMALALALLIAVALLAMWHRKILAQNISSAWVWLGLALITIGMTAGTSGRSGYLLFIPGILVFAWHYAAHRWAWIVVVFSVIFLALSYQFVPKMHNRTTQAWVEMHQAIAVIDNPSAAKILGPQKPVEMIDPGQNAATYDITETSVGLRVGFYLHASRLIKMHPWLGVGTGAFGKAYADLIDHTPATAFRAKIHEPHNQFLYIWAEHGMVGLLLFFSFWVAAWRQIGLSRIAPLGYAVLLGWSLTSLFSSHFKMFAEGFMVMSMLGLVFALCMDTVAEKNPV